MFKLGAIKKIEFTIREKFKKVIFEREMIMTEILLKILFEIKLLKIMEM